MTFSPNKNFLKWTIWFAAFVCVGIMLYVHVAKDYRADAPLGVAAGLAAFLFIIGASLSGWFRRKRGGIAQAARIFHGPIGTLALALVLAHEHLHWRDWAGLVAAILFVAVYASSVFAVHTPQIRWIRMIHRYGGYALLLLAPVHGIHALFFAGA